MKAVCVLQARLGSTRLPGKVMLELAGRPVLEHVIRRCGDTPGIDEVVCATVDEAASAPIVALCRTLGTTVVFGPEADVLERFRLAAVATRADIVMRVTTDCPLADPALSGEVLALVTLGEAAFAANNMPHSFPHGLDCEVFTRDLLERAAREAVDAYDREHVTPWMRRHPDVCRRAVPGPAGGVEKWRWTVDYPEDLAFLEALMARLAPDQLGDWQAARRVLEAEPELLEINRVRWQR